MQNGSLFTKLFDFSFREFVTLQIVQYLYVLSILIASIGAFSTIGGGIATLQYSFWGGIGGILMGPVVFFVVTLLVRLVLEALVATFRIAENTTLLVERNQQP